MKNIYKCVHCGHIIGRDSSKKWIPSYCSEKGKNVRLQLIKESFKCKYVKREGESCTLNNNCTYPNCKK